MTCNHGRTSNSKNTAWGWDWDSEITMTTLTLSKGGDSIWTVRRDDVSALPEILGQMTMF
jgi:hypothetical protein